MIAAYGLGQIGDHSGGMQNGENYVKQAREDIAWYARMTPQQLEDSLNGRRVVAFGGWGHKRREVEAFVRSYHAENGSYPRHCVVADACGVNWNYAQRIGQQVRNTETA